MNRKEFLQTLGSAAASAAALSMPSFADQPAPVSPAPATPPPHKLTRGVSFYSYQAAYYSGTMSVEDCIAEASAIGARGLEVIADAMIPDFPTPSTRWVDKWWDWMDKYGTVPVNYCGSHDTMILGYRPLTTAEGAERLTRDIHCAHRLGFTQMRLLGATPLDVVEKCVPIAEKHNISLNFEIHGPNELDGRLVEVWVKFFEKVQSKHVGLNPDMSLFEKRPQALRRDQLIRHGLLNPNIAKYIDQARAQGIPRAAAESEIKKMGARTREIDYLDRSYRGYQDPKKLLPLKQYCHHMHAKVYGVTEDFQEICIAYEEVIPFLIQNGFEMCLTTEYEGQRFIMDAEQEDEVEQVRRHQLLLKRLLGV